MSAYVFLGPTLPKNEARSILDAVYMPPVSQGDVGRVVREGAQVIGIIDGYFENVPAVWHKEILYAMSRGVHVLGCSSMGALRAAELGYPALSEAMVNIRRTLADALAGGVIDRTARCGLEVVAKSLHYRDRTWSRVLEQGSLAGVAPRQLDALVQWLPEGRIDQKREDAIQMLQLMSVRFSEPARPKTVTYHFEHTTLWAATLEQRSGSGAAAE